MSRRKLSIIVTCTDRKSAVPDAALMARNLPRAPVTARSRAWNRAIESARDSKPLNDLYRGESWTQVKRLVATALSRGYAPDVYVASAGLGLRSVSEFAPAYAATFSRGQLDSITFSLDEARRWWSTLPRSPEAFNGGSALWILSETYSKVIAGDLLADMSSDALLVVGGSADLPADLRLPADRSLRRALGGTATSLNIRMAIKWLELANRERLTSDAAQEAWEQWATRERHHERYDRRPLSDSAVVNFVVALSRREPEISKTRALQTLRAAGLACEQRRFSALYAQVVGP